MKKLRDHLIWVKAILNPTSFSNGRYVRNVIEKSIRSQAMRILMQNSYDRHELMTFRSIDLVFEED
jgi:stage V sporulation protein K